MLIKQIIEFQLRGRGPPGRTCTPNWLTSRQNKNLEGKFSKGSLFTAKILEEAMCLTYPYMGQITYN